MDKNSKLYKMRQKYISHPLQGVGAYLAYWMFALMPIDTASAFGGWLLRSLGPKVGQTKKARTNLVAAFPEKSPEEIDRIIVGMWDNLGRSIAEIPHLHKMRPGGPRIEIVGIENGLATKTDDKAGLFFSGHIGNWEVAMCIARSARYGYDERLSRARQSLGRKFVQARAQDVQRPTGQKRPRRCPQTDPLPQRRWPRLYAG